MKKIFLILPLLLIVGCSYSSQGSNQENFKTWLENKFNMDILSGNHYPGGRGNFYLAKDIEIKLWESFDEGNIKAEAIIIAYPLPYFEATPSVQDTLEESQFFLSKVNIEYAICNYNKRLNDWDLFIGSWEIDKINNVDKERVPKIAEIYSRCVFVAAYNQILYQDNNIPKK
jgi:hypothetical protein